MVHFSQNLTDSAKVCTLKDVQGGIPKSDLLGFTVALIHVGGQILGAIGLTVAK